MRLNIDNIDPEVIGLIYEDKARHKHSTLAETLECLVKRAMVTQRSNLTETIENVVKKMIGKHNKEGIVVEEKYVVEDKYTEQLHNK